MKKLITTVMALFYAILSFAQVGVGTVTPNSTLDVRGSVATNYRAFTASTTATATDNLLVFTGTGAATVTLPTAVGCDGRSYMIKNASTTGPVPVLTIATTSAQTIDGAASWALSTSNESITLISNGANWNVSIQSAAAAAGSNWAQDGNTLAATKSIGTISNHSLPFITNNTEKMRLTNTGNLGIATTTPNSTFDVRGSVSTNYRAFTSATTATATDNLLVFTGTTATTVTLPTAVGCDGRSYMIKNASTTGPTPALTIATTASQTIDAAGSWSLTSVNETITLISNGANWMVAAQSLPGGSGTNWSQNGNSVPSLKSIGTISNYSLPFITNNTEKMRLTNTGSLGVGTSTFNATNPEKLLVDAGTTSSVNAIVGKGSIDNYLQLNIQNNSAGTSSSSDVVATANNGDETSNYIDMGINGGNNTSNIMGAANDAYLYNIGQNLLVGTGTANKSLVFMTGGTSQSANERMRIDGTGKVGIGTTAPATALHVAGTNPLTLMGVQTGTNTSTDSVLTIASGLVKKLPASTFLTTAAGNNLWAQGGNTVTSAKTLGTIDNNYLPFITNNTERMRIDASGRVGVGVTNPANPLVVKDTMEIRRTGSVAELLFTNTSGFGDFRIGGDGSDIYWQGGGGRELQMGAYWGIVLGGDRQLSSFPAFSAGNATAPNTGVLVQSQRDASVPLAVQSNSATQSANLTEWRTSSGSVMNVVKANGSVGIGTTSFNATNPEKLVVDAGTTTSVNAIVGKGSIDSYLQLNIQNNSTGTSASSDVVATANNGNESSNYIDMGINGGNYTGGVMGAANDGYMYTMGNNFLIGTANASKSVVFMTGGTTQSTNERMRIDGNGNVGVGTNAPTSTLQVAGSQALAITTKTATYTATANDHTIVCNNAGAMTVNLPAAAGCSGRVYVIKKISAALNNVTVDGNGAETIDGAATRILSLQYESVMIQSNGTSWFILANN
jgi:hypothetical protein